MVNLRREGLSESPTLSYFPPLTLTINSAQRELNSTILLERMNEGMHYGDDGQLLGTTSLSWLLLAPAFLFSLSFPKRKLKAVINHRSTAEDAVSTHEQGHLVTFSLHGSYFSKYLICHLYYITNN